MRSNRVESKLPSKVISIFSQKSRYWHLTACIVIMLVTYFLIRLLLNDQVIVNAGGQVAIIRLPDSSKVWLNVNSSLSYSKDFEERIVKLKGEGFFSVTKSNATFTVITENSTTQVLGTAFDLNEEFDSIVTLTVAEGAVNFDYKDSKGEKMLIQEGEKAVLSKTAGILISKNVDPKFAYWRFDNNETVNYEETNPIRFLSNEYTWRKNEINQSVITGVIVNHATLCAYRKIMLSITFTKEDGTNKNIEFILPETIYPGKQLKYRKGLFDILTNPKSVVVNIKSAEAIAL